MNKYFYARIARVSDRSKYHVLRRARRWQCMIWDERSERIILFASDTPKKEIEPSKNNYDKSMTKAWQ